MAGRPREEKEPEESGADLGYFRSPRVIEVSSAAFDLDKAGVGSTYFQGDAANTGLPIPAFSREVSVSFFRLCGLRVPPMQVARILGLRTVVTLRHVQTVSAPPDAWSIPIEREVVSPLWAFPDGNVSFYLRVIRGITKRPWNSDPGRLGGIPLPPQQIGTSPDIYGTSSARLYVPELWGVGPSAPVAILGEPVGSLGTWRDAARFPWGNLSLNLDYEVEGPAVIALFAVVKQTNPETRPTMTLPGGIDPAIVAAGLRPEDAFVLTYPDTQYGHVGGAFVADVGPSERLDRPAAMPWRRMIDRIARHFR